MRHDAALHSLLEQKEHSLGLVHSGARARDFQDEAASLLLLTANGYQLSSLQHSLGILQFFFCLRPGPTH